jgi:muramoyltetrapeptide carboxypeptidase LdcA involved in peptidoglycan recycling
MACVAPRMGRPRPAVGSFRKVGPLLDSMLCMPAPLKILPPVRPGDRVAVLSPSWAAPAVFPAVHERALERLRSELDVVPVEFATTRVASTARERAADINAAFADPSIRAVLATIGGDDQITVLKHLDPTLATKDPKPFIGYSDNTNLLNWLWFHGIAGIHGGSTQVHLGPGPRIDDQHLTSLRAALYGGDVDIEPVPRTRDIGIRWDDPRVFTDPAPDEPAEPWTWSGPSSVVSGPTWGGNLEILQWNLATGRWIHPVEAYAGCILVLETSEERPPPSEVYRMLRNMGERGLLEVCPALIWGRPPVGDHDRHPSPEEAASLRRANRDAVSKAVSEYHPDMLVVMDVDLGHTSPQWVVPYGGQLTVDGERQRLTAHFGGGPQDR